MAGRVSSKSNDLGKRDFKGKVWSALFTCFIASWGGFIFGFDLGITGGVTSNSNFMEKFFPSSTLCESETGVFKVSQYLVALITSKYASVVKRRIGGHPRMPLLIGGLIFFTGAALEASAMNLYMLIGGRILVGISFGFIDQCRGALNIFVQLMFSLGILAASIVTFGMANIKDEWGWRLSLALAAIPSGLIVIGACIMPDTLNSIIECNDPQKAKNILRKIRGSGDVDEEFNTLVKESDVSQVKDSMVLLIRERKYMPHYFFAILIPSFQGLAGANVFLFYCPILLGTLGFGNNGSQFSSVIVCFVNVLATVASMYVIDKKGRRWLLVVGGTLMFIFQLLVGIILAVKFWPNGVETIGIGYAFVVVVCICGYVAAFACSWGPLGWVVTSEICPPEILSAAQNLSLCVYVCTNSYMVVGFPLLMCHLKYGIFFLFAFLVVWMTHYICTKLPETKGVPIEEMWVLWKQHKVWGNCIPNELVMEPGLHF